MRKELSPNTACKIPSQDPSSSKETPNPAPWPIAATDKITMRLHTQHCMCRLAKHMAVSIGKAWKFALHR